MAVRLAPLAPVAAESHQITIEHPIRPYFVRTHEQCVRVAHVVHTTSYSVLALIHVAHVAGVVAQMHRPHAPQRYEDQREKARRAPCCS